MNRMFVALVVSILFAAGCTSTPRRGPDELSGGDWVDPTGAETAVRPPDRAEALHGLPPLWFYEKGADGYFAMPLLASYHEDDYHFWLLGVLNMGWTSEEAVAEGSEEGYRTTDWDFNLVGLHNSTTERVRTPGRIVERRSHRFLWALPIWSSEVTRTATGTVSRSWLFGLIPLD